VGSSVGKRFWAIDRVGFGFRLEYARVSYPQHEVSRRELGVGYGGPLADGAAKVLLGSAVIGDLATFCTQFGRFWQGLE